MSISVTPQVSCWIDLQFAIWAFIERLAILRDSAKLAPRNSRDTRLDQLWEPEPSLLLLAHCQGSKTSYHFSGRLPQAAGSSPPGRRPCGPQASQ